MFFLVSSLPLYEVTPMPNAMVAMGDVFVILEEAFSDIVVAEVVMLLMIFSLFCFSLAFFLLARMVKPFTHLTRSLKAFDLDPDVCHFERATATHQPGNNTAQHAA